MEGLRRDLLTSPDRTMRGVERVFSPTTRYIRSKKAVVAPLPLNTKPLSSSNQTTPIHHNNMKPKQDSASKPSSHKKVSSSIDRVKSSKAVETEVDFQSILRIRPFNVEEQGEKQIFSISNGDSNTISLLPRSKESRRQKDLLLSTSEYHFDTILNENSTQRDAYMGACGEDMAWDAVLPLFQHNDATHSSGSTAKQHVIVSVGVSNSGKTYTVLGDHDTNKEGIVPRLFDDIFAYGKELRRKKTRQHVHEQNIMNLGVQLSMVHLHNDHVYDMLSSLDNDSVSDVPIKRTSSVLEKAALYESRSFQENESFLRELKIKRDRHTHDFKIDPIVITCHSASEARKKLHEGLKHSVVSSTNLNKSSSRGHTIISIRPILNENHRLGDSITVIDLAGIERTKTSEVSGKALRESVSINTAIFAVLQCLRSIKTIHGINEFQENINPEHEKKSKVIPYRENKLTMLLQPLFSGNVVGRSQISNVKTTVKIFVSVYPGTKDYNAKKALMGEIDSLRGLRTHCSKKSRRGLHTEESSTVSSPEVLSKHPEATYTAKNTTSPFKLIANVVKTSTSYKRKAEFQHLLERVQNLENDNEKLRDSYHKSKKICSTLENKNIALARELEHSKQVEIKLKEQIKAAHDQETTNVEDDERTKQAEREFRRQQQTLLPSQLVDHMKSVEAHRVVYYGTVNGEVLTKPPFQLHIPSKENDKDDDVSTNCDYDDVSSYSA